MWSCYPLIKMPQWLSTRYKIKSKFFNHATSPSMLGLFPASSVLYYHTSCPMLQWHQHPWNFPENTRWVQACDLYTWMASSPSFISVHLSTLTVASHRNCTPTHQIGIDHSFLCASQHFPLLQHKTCNMLYYFLFKWLNKGQGLCLSYHWPSFAYQNVWCMNKHFIYLLMKKD